MRFFFKSEFLERKDREEVIEIFLIVKGEYFYIKIIY